MQKWFARIAKREEVMLFITEMLQEPGGEGFFFSGDWGFQTLTAKYNGEMEYDKRIPDFSYFTIQW